MMENRDSRSETTATSRHDPSASQGVIESDCSDAGREEALDQLAERGGALALTIFGLGGFSVAVAIIVVLKFGHAMSDALIATGTIVSAIATAVVAVFTIKLTGATKALKTETRATLEHLERSSRQELRAYVNVVSAVMTGHESTVPTAAIVMRNCGKTPAYNVRSWISMWIAEYPLTETLTYPPHDFRTSSSILAPDGRETMFIRKSPPIAHEYVKELGTHTGTIYVYGEIRYRDAFGSDRWTKYRLMFGGPEGHPGIEGRGVDGNMSPCQEGNDAT